jgi:hypothetical protein
MVVDIQVIRERLGQIPRSRSSGRKSNAACHAGAAPFDGFSFDAGRMLIPPGRFWKEPVEVRRRHRAGGGIVGQSAATGAAVSHAP